MSSVFVVCDKSAKKNDKIQHIVFFVLKKHKIKWRNCKKTIDKILRFWYNKME